jgi:hypothetical protein
LAAAACLAVAPGVASALSVARSGYGIQADLLNNANGTPVAFNLNGAGISLGQVEGGRPGDPDLLGAGMAPELAHQDVNPGNAGVLGGVGVARVINGGGAVVGTIQFPPTVDFNLDDHATQVAGVMISTNNPQRGIAPGASLFSAAYVFVGPGTQDEAITAMNWVTQPPPVPAVRIVNCSFGKNLNNAEHLGGPAALDGNNLLSLYVDFNASQNNVLSVIAGNEDTLGTIPAESRPISIATDAYNAIVVGATSQRANGANVRFDQVSNINTIGNVRGAPGQGGGAGDPTYSNRAQTDIVAPGSSNVEYDVFLTGTNTVARTVRVLPPALGPGESIRNLAGNLSRRDLAASSDPTMPTLVDTDGNGTFASGDATNRFAANGGTSFAAPQVTATLGLMLQQNNAAGHLDLKASVLNSASKHVMSKIANDPLVGGGDPAGAFDGQAWPVRYLARNPNPANMTAPKDPDSGIGQLNALAAVKQIASGARTDLGYSSDTVAAGGSVSIANLAGGQTLKPGSLVSATLVWDRPVTNTGSIVTLADYTPAGAAPGTAPATPANLDLELWKVGGAAPVAASRSAADNVEHIYFNVRDEGQYFLRVRNNDAARATAYSVAMSSGTSDGISFSVDGGAFNPARVGSANPAQGRNGGFAGAPFPNDVNSLGTAGAGFFPTEGEIFTSSANGTNMLRISGALQTRSRVGPFNAPPAAMTMLDSTNTQRGVLGLQPNDNVDGLSYGRDGSGFAQDSVLVFSVDTAAQGAAGTAVRFQAVDSPSGGIPAPGLPLPTNIGGGEVGNGHEAAGDIFASAKMPHFGRYNSAELAPAAQNSNRLHTDEIQLGLHAGNGKLLPGREDNLNALEMDSPLEVDPDGDGMNSAPIFFNLARTSPSLSPTKHANDIFIARGKDPNPFGWNDTPSSNFTFEIFANGVTNIGLTAGDAIDALAVSDVGFEGNPDGPDGLIGPFDEALFSLDPGSPSGSAGDIYFTDFNRPFNPGLRWDQGGSLFATAAELGLSPADNLDALDVFTVPEPAAMSLVIGIGAALMTRRRRANSLSL